MDTLGVDTDSPYGVYVIECEPKHPGSDAAFYVGSSTYDPVVRFEEHLSGDPYRSSPMPRDRARRLAPEFYAGLPGACNENVALRLEGALATFLATCGFETHSDRLKKELRNTALRPDPILPDGWEREVAGLAHVKLPTVYGTVEDLDNLSSSVDSIAGNHPEIKSLPVSRQVEDLRRFQEDFKDSVREAELATKYLRMLSRRSRFEVGEKPGAKKGSLVTYEFLSNDKKRLLVALGEPSNENPDVQLARYGSPIYIALLGGEEGDEREVHLPSGTDSIRIVEIS